MQLGNPSPYWNPDMAKQKSLQDYLQFGDQVMSHDFYPNPLPKFDYLSQAGQNAFDAGNIRQESNINAANNAANNFANSAQNPTGAGGYGLAAVLRALRAQESGGNYSAQNGDSGAMGAYQIMPANIAGRGGWDMEALGRNVSNEEFLNNRRIQNQIARYKFGGYMDKYGLRGALSSWYSGSPTLWNDRDPQGNYPSIHDYVMQVLNRLRG
jgi:hypothetical protein